MSTLPTGTDVFGRTYTAGDIVLVAHYDSGARINHMIALELTDVQYPAEVSGIPLASSSYTMTWYYGLGKRKRTYTHLDRVFVMPGLTRKQALAMPDGDRAQIADAARLRGVPINKILWWEGTSNDKRIKP